MPSSPSVVLKPQQVHIAPARLIEAKEAEQPLSVEERQEAVLAQAQMEAARIVEDARSRADALLAEAQVRAQARREEAERQGYNAGLARAEQATRERVNTAVRLADQLARARQELLRRCEHEVVELGLDIAQKVIGRESTLDGSLVADIARRAIERVCADDTFSLLLNPADAEMVREHLSRYLSDTGWEVVPDYRIAEGGCVITTSHGQVDARVSSQLGEIRNALLGEGDSGD